jgi:type IV pilus assembly protein PilY1
MNLASTNPANWSINLFFDGFPSGSGTDGQPIATPPVISVDQVGNMTIAFSTGDQETLLSSTGMKNNLWSLAETVVADAPYFRSKVLWFSQFDNGKRVTGPMQLFNSILYYTTFTPAVPTSLSDCTSGQSQLCGVHYMNPKDSNLGNGGAPALDNPLASDPPKVQCQELGSKTIAFGPTVLQKPTCGADISYEDPYLGYGKHTGLGGATGSSFELVVQTGSGGTKVAGGATKVATVKLKPPVSASRIDSWAAVIE